MLVLMNLGALGNQDDVYASIDRTVRLWREFGSHTIRDLGRAGRRPIREIRRS